MVDLFLVVVLTLMLCLLLGAHCAAAQGRLELSFFDASAKGLACNLDSPGATLKVPVSSWLRMSISGSSWKSHPSGIVAGLVGRLLPTCFAVARQKCFSFAIQDLASSQLNSTLYK
jgi:hypothetical protein